MLLVCGICAEYAGRAAAFDMERTRRGYVRGYGELSCATGGGHSRYRFCASCSELLHVLHDTSGVIPLICGCITS